MNLLVHICDIYLSYTACGSNGGGGNGATSVVAVPLMIVTAVVIALAKLF